MDRPTIRQLEILVAVAETLGFRRAAEACHVTQPALSAQLKQLEKSLGIQLFERDKRRVLPTPAGRRLAAEARAILERTDDFVDLARACGRPFSGDLRLGVIPTVGPYLLPRVIAGLRERYPELRLLLREDQTQRIVKLLNQGELDLLLLALDVDLEGAESCFLFEDPFVLACAADHPLAAKDLVAEADLRDRTVLLLDEGHCMRDHALPICDRAGLCEVADFRASSLGTLVQMVAEGIGITLLPEMAVQHEAAGNPGLAVRPIDVDGPGRRIGLAWRRRSARGAEFRALGETIAKLYLDADQALYEPRRS